MLRLNFKQLLVIFGFVISSAYSAEVTNLEELQKEMHAVSKMVRSSREAHQGINSIIVIGKTGHGKSTLVTHLAGKPLVAQQGPQGYYLSTADPLPGFNIGSGVGVGTKMPSSWYDPASEVVYWDCPGFSDPRGVSVDIVNAFSIQQLFQSPSSIKVVIALEEGDLQLRAKELGDILKRMTSVFPDNTQLEGCLSLVITRHREEVSPAGILRGIYANPHDSENFNDPRVKALLKVFVDNPGRVSCMPYSVVLGSYAGNRELILASIKKAVFVKNPRFKVVVSEGSRLHIRELSKKTNDAIVSHIRGSTSSAVEKKILDFIRGHKKTARAMKADFAAHAEALGSIKTDNPINFIQGLRTILDQLGLAKHLDDVSRNLSIMDFFKSTDGGIECRTDLWKNALSVVIETIDTLSKTPTSRINPQYSNGREDENTWEVVSSFGSRKMWKIDLIHDVFAQDSTEFHSAKFSGGVIVITDPHTFSGAVKYGTRVGERAHPGWRGGYQEF